MLKLEVGKTYLTASQGAVFIEKSFDDPRWGGRKVFKATPAYRDQEMRWPPEYFEDGSRVPHWCDSEQPPLQGPEGSEIVAEPGPVEGWLWRINAQNPGRVRVSRSKKLVTSFQDVGHGRSHGGTDGKYSGGEASEYTWAITMWTPPRGPRYLEVALPDATRILDLDRFVNAMEWSLMCVAHYDHVSIAVPPPPKMADVVA